MRSCPPNRQRGARGTRNDALLAAEDTEQRAAVRKAVKLSIVAILCAGFGIPLPVSHAADSTPDPRNTEAYWRVADRLTDIPLEVLEAGQRAVVSGPLDERGDSAHPEGIWGMLRRRGEDHPSQNGHVEVRGLTHPRDPGGRGSLEIRPTGFSFTYRGGSGGHIHQMVVVEGQTEGPVLVRLSHLLGNARSEVSGSYAPADLQRRLPWLRTAEVVEELQRLTRDGIPRPRRSTLGRWTCCLIPWFVRRHAPSQGAPRK